jgi:hypothetical protein
MRKRWPNQVRTLKGMKAGYLYTKVYSNPLRSFKEKHLEFICLDYTSSLGPDKCRLKFRTADGNFITHFASDSNLEPYTKYEDNWNEFNYFVRERSHL